MNFFNGVRKTKRLHKWIWHDIPCPWYWEQVKLEIRLRLNKRRLSMERYLAYIRNLDMTYSKAYGNCKEVCEGMKKHFPELRLVRGHYYCAVWGERGHWWLETELHERIDPTAIQFPSKGAGVYVEWDDGQREPTGMCPNCGEYCYDGEQVHEGCYSAFVASLMG